MEKLVSPIKIKNLTLKNRIFALPVFTGYGLPDSRVSPLMLEHYDRLAKSGASVVCIPNVAVDKKGSTSNRSLLIDHDDHIPGLKRLASTIKKNNALACLQLNHAGRYAITDQPMLPSSLHPSEIANCFTLLKSFMETFPFVKRFGLTGHVAKMTSGWRYQMSNSDIEKTIQLFGDAAYRAHKAGFDMIELHGATGYLIAQFLSPLTNRRPWPWGGSAKARMHFALKIIEKIRTRIPSDMPLGFRLILDEKIKNGITFDEAKDFAQKLEKTGVDYLSCTIGAYQSIFITEVAKQLAKPGYLKALTKKLKKHVSIPVVISGRIVSASLAEKILQNDQTDIIGLGRPLLADPKWIKKSKRGQKVVSCKNCNTCFKNLVLGQSVICDRWPKVEQDRVKLETRFTSKHGYRTLIILSSIKDLETSWKHLKLRVPIHQDIFDRELFLDTGREPNFRLEVGKYLKKCNRYLKTHLKRGKVEHIFIPNCHNPVEIVMEHLKENFGFVSFVHEQDCTWKNQLVLKIPSDIGVFREGTHPNLKNVLVPCDLSTFTLMQIRVALHVYQGRSKTKFHFVHVTDSDKSVRDNWQAIIDKLEIDPNTELKIIQTDSNSNVSETLLRMAEQGNYGCLVLARRGGLAFARRKILGSVSEYLLKNLQDRSFAIIG